MAESSAMDVDSIAPLPLLSQLNGLLKEGNDAAVLKSVEKILVQYPRDVDVGCVKAVALLQLSRLADAVAWFNSFPEVASQLPFERAYGLYRLGALREALEVVNESISGVQSRGDSSASLLLYRLSLLRAQVLYRLEEFQESAEAFGGLRASVLASDSQDLEANFAGASAAARTVASSGGVGEAAVDAGLRSMHDADGYDVMYNAACVALSRSEYSPALELLRSAEAEIQRAMSEDEVAENDLAGELAVIRAQTAYALQLLDRRHDATTLYSNILSDRRDKGFIEGSQSSVLSVAANNLVAMRAQLDVQGARRALRKALDSRASARLLSFQRTAIQLNLSALTEFAQTVPSKSREAASAAVSAAERIAAVDAAPTVDSGSALGVPGAVRVRRPGRKKKQVRLPKNFDPNVKPDPERWLPRRERSTFKKKKGRGKQQQQQNMQQGSLPPPAPTQKTAKASAGAVKAARDIAPSAFAAADSPAAAAAGCGAAGVLAEQPRKPQASKKKSVAQKKRKRK